MFRESSLITYDNVIIDFQKGTSSLVEFDFMKLWEFKKLLKENFNPSLLHFYHVHPESFGTLMSDVDINCIKGLSMALKFEVINFSIVVFLKDTYEMKTHYWESDLDIFFIAPNELNKIEYYILKNLSEGE
jgi:hypothetical protein